MKIKTAIKIAIIDWDGTLCNSAPHYMKLLNTVIKENLGKPVSLKWVRESALALDTPQVLQQTGITDVEKAWNEYQELARNYPPPPIFKDTLTTLQWLNEKEIKIYVASARQHKDLITLIRNYALVDLIYLTLGGLDLQAKIVLIKNAIREDSLNPQEIIFMDDMDNILTEAKKTGCWVVGSSGGFCSIQRLKAVNPHAIISSPAGLKDFINDINTL